ncbi:MAG: undecaprenyl-diphosphate phosphatase [Elusimicrobia bacterium]|nr:undecaprenyl-diphosphate phosphatase [Elusimicrobiota bacterium]
MTYAHSVLLGTLQGFAEFLPISSSAHLALAPWAFGFPDPGLTFDVALHVGTLAAIAAAFGGRWWTILSGAARQPRGENGRKLAALVLATVPGAIIGLIFEKKAEEAFRDPRLIAGAMIVFGLMMEACDRFGAKARDWAQGGWRTALAVGAAQAFAVVPGVSRAGSTMSAGLAMGLTRESSAELSFLMAAPIIAGAAILKLRHLTGADLTGPFICGILVAAGTGWVAVNGLLRWITRYGLRPYVIYRVLLGLGVFALYWAR